MRTIRRRPADARVRSVKMTARTLRTMKRLSDAHGISQGEVMERLAAFLTMLDDAGAQAYCLGVAPGYSEFECRAAFMRAIRRVTEG